MVLRFFLIENLHHRTTAAQIASSKSEENAEALLVVVWSVNGVIVIGLAVVVVGAGWNTHY